jgi:hypothetical protein
MKLPQHFYRNLFCVNIILFLATLISLLDENIFPPDASPIVVRILFGVLISTLITWLILLILSINLLFRRLKIGLIGLALLVIEFLLLLAIPAT